MFSVDIPADPYYRPLVRGDLGEITQSELQRVYEFIMLNRETLLVFWVSIGGMRILHGQIVKHLIIVRTKTV